MTRCWRWIGMLLLGIALVVPTTAAGDKKQTSDKKDDKKEQKNIKKEDVKAPAKEAFVYGQVFVGKIKALDPKGRRELTVEWTAKVSVPDPSGQRRLANLQRQLAEQQFRLASARDLKSRANISRDIARTQLEMAKVQLTKIEELKKDVPLLAAEKIKVALRDPPPDYDDKGYLRNYTADELKKMRCEYLPGYKAEWDAIRQGQIVQVYLARPPAPAKGIPLKGKKSADPAKGKKSADLDDLGVQPRSEVVGLLVLSEPK